MFPISRSAKLLLGTILLVLSGCTSGGHFNILGYSTVPNYDNNIRTVYVPIFQNKTMRRGVEFDMTRAVIREIESKTPYKVVSCREHADTELLGTVVARRKAIINANQVNEVREGQVTLAAEVVWRDLRAGHTDELLSQPNQPNNPNLPGPPGMKTPLPGPGGVVPVLISPTGNFIPELGGSVTSAEQLVVNQIAVQIISMMEIWPGFTGR